MTAAAAKAAKQKAAKPKVEETKDTPEVEETKDTPEVEETKDTPEDTAPDTAPEATSTEEGAEQERRASEDIFVELRETLFEELEDGVSKSHVLIALESVETRAHEVKISQAARRQAEQVAQEMNS